MQPVPGYNEKRPTCLPNGRLREEVRINAPECLFVERQCFSEFNTDMRNRASKQLIAISLTASSICFVISTQKVVTEVRDQSFSATGRRKHNVLLFIAKVFSLPRFQQRDGRSGALELTKNLWRCTC